MLRIKALLLSVLLLLPLSYSLAIEATPQVVAEVNGEKILFHELEREVRQLLTIDLHLIPKDQLNRLKRNILTRLVDRKLLLQEAKRQKITNIDQTKRATEPNNLDLERLQQRLAEDSVIMALIDKEIEKSAEASTTNDLNKKHLAWDESEYFIKQIVVPVPDFATPKEFSTAQNQAEEIYRQSSTNAEVFANYLENYAKGSTQWPQIGAFSITLNQIDPNLRTIVDSLKPSEISPPINTAQGFHIIQKIPADPRLLPVDSVKIEPSQHSIINIQKRNAMIRLLNRLKKDGQIIVYYN